MTMNQDELKDLKRILEELFEKYGTAIKMMEDKAALEKIKRRAFDVIEGG
jgi:hypothetical protein